MSRAKILHFQTWAAKSSLLVPPLVGWHRGNLLSAGGNHLRKTAEPQDGKNLGPGPTLGGEHPGEESVMRAKKKKQCIKSLRGRGYLLFFFMRVHCVYGASCWQMALGRRKDTEIFSLESTIQEPPPEIKVLDPFRPLSPWCSISMNKVVTTTPAQAFICLLFWVLCSSNNRALRDHLDLPPASIIFTTLPGQAFSSLPHSIRFHVT